MKLLKFYPLIFHSAVTNTKISFWQTHKYKYIISLSMPETNKDMIIYDTLTL